MTLDGVGRILPTLSTLLLTFASLHPGLQLKPRSGLAHPARCIGVLSLPASAPLSTNVSLLWEREHRPPCESTEVSSLGRGRRRKQRCQSHLQKPATTKCCEASSVFLPHTLHAVTDSCSLIIDTSLTSSVLPPRTGHWQLVAVNCV